MMHPLGHRHHRRAGPWDLTPTLSQFASRRRALSGQSNLANSRTPVSTLVPVLALVRVTLPIPVLVLVLVLPLGPNRVRVRVLRARRTPMMHPLRVPTTTRVHHRRAGPWGLTPTLSQSPSRGWLTSGQSNLANSRTPISTSRTDCWAIWVTSRAVRRRNCSELFFCLVFPRVLRVSRHPRAVLRALRDREVLVFFRTWKQGAFASMDRTHMRAVKRADSAALATSSR